MLEMIPESHSCFAKSEFKHALFEFGNSRGQKHVTPKFRRNGVVQSA